MADDLATTPLPDDVVKFNIDFEKDVQSVARFNIYPSFLIVTTTNFDAKDVNDLVAQAKAALVELGLHLVE